MNILSGENAAFPIKCDDTFSKWKKAVYDQDSVSLLAFLQSVSSLFFFFFKDTGLTGLTGSIVLSSSQWSSQQRPTRPLTRWSIIATKPTSLIHKETN